MFNKLFPVATVLSSLLALADGAPQLLPGPWIVPGPADFKVTNFSVIGTGCPPGSVYSFLGPDRNAFTVVFNEYYVEVGQDGGGIPAARNRRNCRLSFGVDVASADYRGYYQLDDRVAASQNLAYYCRGFQCTFVGRLVQSTTRRDFVGPLDGAEYTYHDAFDLLVINNSPCGGETVLNVQSELRVSNSQNVRGGRSFAAHGENYYVSSIERDGIVTSRDRRSTCNGKLVVIKAQAPLQATVACLLAYGGKRSG
ncbi:hypothetical protein CC1G_08268 [Coprinopsis cinerea okayama7|uniref:Secreted protein n=1 Tax=Coprinopsis cinerea (strain Okayama-7 / 130 / ATCC MYA-4618 / FGSC 9003) TaxID=240176 RepID=A8PG22_COPC7|nr:hypothetical protein CC1G_08268 [Coprinopsis cinerea okayama7\|eukprot:XP_001841124.2 hypothetical protein CC1G_08268 [Coprinopsis cinerea okayama7\